MLAPIVTKDMRLFPSRPLPNGIKNVRSRAKSLDQFQNLQNTCSSAGRVVPVKHRTSVSTGNLANSTNSTTNNHSFRERKSTLMAIQEGEEMFIRNENAIQNIPSASEPSLKLSSLPSKKLTASQAAKLQAAKQQRNEKSSPNSSKSSSPCSSSGMDESSKKRGSSDNASGKVSKSRRVVQWFATALHKHHKVPQA